MSVFSMRSVGLVCGRCGSPIGRASYRMLPGRLDVMDLSGGLLPGERAGRLLQQLTDPDTGAQVDSDRKCLAEP